MGLFHNGFGCTYGIEFLNKIWTEFTVRHYGAMEVQIALEAPKRKWKVRNCQENPERSVESMEPNNGKLWSNIVQKLSKNCPKVMNLSFKPIKLSRQF